MVNLASAIQGIAHGSLGLKKSSLITARPLFDLLQIPETRLQTAGSLNAHDNLPFGWINKQEISEAIDISLRTPCVPNFALFAASLVIAFDMTDAPLLPECVGGSSYSC